MFVTAIAGFTILSFLCATAANVQELILFRVLQGTFAGGIDATSNTVLSSTFPPAKIGLAQSIFSLSAACAPPIGLLLGGILTDQLSWQWCFLINVPLGTAAAVLLGFLLKNPDQAVAATRRPAIDTAGVALLAVGPSLLVYFLSEGDRYDWFGSTSITIACVGGVLATLGFVFWELRGTRTPIVDLRIFRHRPRRDRRRAHARHGIRLSLHDGVLTAVRARDTRLYADAMRPDGPSCGRCR